MQQNNSFHLKTNAKIFHEPNQNISFHFWTSTLNNRLHKHEFFELFLATDGPIKHVLNGNATIVEKGTLLLIRPSDTHKFVSHQNKSTLQFDLKVKDTLFELLCSAIDDTLYQRIIAAQSPISYILKPHEFEYFSKAIETAHLVPESRADMTVQPLLRTIATTFLFYVHTALKEEPSKYPQWFSQFLLTLNTPSSFTKPLSELYKFSTYSQRQLNTYFKKYMNSTIVAYVIKQKMNYACNLLRTTNHTIIHIATLSGYTTLNHFNHIFKEHIGVPPSVYRKRFRNTEK